MHRQRSDITPVKRGRLRPAAFRAWSASVLALLLWTAAARPSSAAQPEPGDADVSAHAVDLRPKLDQWKLPPRAQGGRNTCSAFVVSGALEYALARSEGRGTRLSVEFLNWASNEAIGRAEDGGFFFDLWKGFQGYGICAEAELPYRATFEPHLRPPHAALESAKRLASAGLRWHWIKPWNVKTGLTDAHLAAIKRTLGRQWPVCAGLRWPKAERWNDGVLQMAPPEGVRDGHSVLLVGFRDDAAQPGGGTFTFRNSAKDARDGRMTYEYAKAYTNDAGWIDYCPTRNPPAVDPSAR
jgi:hypothetical protein